MDNSGSANHARDLVRRYGLPRTAADILTRAVEALSAAEELGGIEEGDTYADLMSAVAEYATTSRDAFLSTREEPSGPSERLLADAASARATRGRVTR